MKTLAIASALVLGATLLPAGPAQAKGCLKGAVVGGVAGRYAANHGVLGALAGCVVGRHYANRKAARTNRAPPEYGSSAPPRYAPNYR